MKIHKVLLGVIAGVFALMGGSAKAQFYEIGPDNIGGQLSSLLIDQRDTVHLTVFAGASTGGLFVQSNDTAFLQHLYSSVEDQELAEKLSTNFTSWHHIVYIDASGQETTLPISAMTQGTDGTIYIGTGDDTYPLGTTYTKMSAKGRGIYRFNPNTLTFTLIPYTSTTNSDRFNAVHELACYSKGDSLFLYAATNTGLYRWSVKEGADEQQWNATPRLVQAGNIDQLLVVRQLNIAYFTIGNQLYRIGDLTAPDTKLNPVNISSSNPAFGGKNTTIKLAAARTNPSYLYALVTDQNGIMDNVYLTTNGQTWFSIATSSVTPFSYYSHKNDNGGFDTTVFNSGLQCGAIAVDPTNEKRILIGGSSIWIGEGFLEGGIYTWSRGSYSERELGSGDYMSSVYNSAFFCHSGIHAIQPINYPQQTGDADGNVFFVATDGGCYLLTVDGNNALIANNNRNLNNLQINSIAVSPDGSIISGADYNANPFVEARLAHHGGESTPTWFDNGELGNTNHSANILWHGDGGKVAASSFQQINVMPHRNIFVSAANGSIGRSYADYLDYTNSQTWTTGSSFLTSEVVGGPAKGSLHLWETNNNRYLKDSVKVALDMRGHLIKANGDTLYFTLKDKDGKDSLVNRNYRIAAGDHATFLSKANSDYPFDYTFTAREAGKLATDTFKIKSPLASRLLIVASISNTQTSVLYSWTASDFSKIYDSIVDNNRNLNDAVKSELREKFMWWSPMYTVSRNSILNTTHLYARDAVLSPDGRYAYISTYDDSLHRSQLVRISGFENVNFSAYPLDIRRQINFASDTSNRVLRNTIISRKSGNNREWFNRPISSITVDPRPGVDRIVITFEDYSESYANVAIIENASTNNWEIIQNPTAGIIGLPAYCSMIEDSTGNIYVGTADGVYIYDNNAAAWRQYPHLRGVPVTSIVQQTTNYPVVRTTNHTGITENNYLFAKTKWHRAIYFGTYGRGIFMDMTYVTDMTNEISDPEDYNPAAIPTVEGNGESSISIYPNPVMGEANLSINATQAGNATLRIYDLNGRMVNEQRLGHVSEGEQTYSISTEGMTKGMYLVNVIISGHTAATKMIVR